MNWVTSAEETDEFTEEDVASAFTDDTENEVAEAQSSIRKVEVKR